MHIITFLAILLNLVKWGKSSMRRRTVGTRLFLESWEGGYAMTSWTVTIILVREKFRKCTLGDLVLVRLADDHSSMFLYFKLHSDPTHSSPTGHVLECKVASQLLSRSP